jgi:peptide/nickel transport system permease protein
VARVVARELGQGAHPHFLEQIFRIPGIGSLLISAILANDTPVIMAVTFVFACLVVVFNLLADIIYGWLDPRISYR